MIGKRIISTRLRANVTIREENAVAALEIMSRFAANPEVAHLLCRPPCRRAKRATRTDSLNTRPRRSPTIGLTACRQVVCEEKHMGSRAVVIVCRDEQAAQERFGSSARRGSFYTRTGRRFFTDSALEDGVPRPDSGGDGRQRLLVAVQHGLGLPGLRIDALVGQGPGIASLAVRRRGSRRPGIVANRPWPHSDRPPTGWPAEESPGQSTLFIRCG